MLCGAGMAVYEGVVCLRVWWFYGYPSYIFTPYGCDFSFVRHSSSELCSALIYRDNSKKVWLSYEEGCCVVSVNWCFVGVIL